MSWINSWDGPFANGARLPIAVSRLGDIVDAVEQYGIGESFDERDLGDMAAVIDRLLDPDTNRRLKANVMRAAEDMTWEKESVAYVALMRALAASSRSDTSSPSGQSGAVTRSRNGCSGSIASGQSKSRPVAAGVQWPAPTLKPFGT